MGGGHRLLGTCQQLYSAFNPKTSSSVPISAARMECRYLYRCHYFLVVQNKFIKNSLQLSLDFSFKIGSIPLDPDPGLYPDLNTDSNWNKIQDSDPTSKYPQHFRHLSFRTIGSIRSPKFITYLFTFFSELKKLDNEYYELV